MRFEFEKTCRIASFIAILAACSWGWEAGASEEPPANALPTVTGDVANVILSFIDSDAPKRPEAASEYWIGINGNPIEEALRSQLALEEGRGLLVTEIVGDSPAAKAGLKIHDVLLSAGDKPLHESGDLAAIIDEGKGTKLTIALIRGGKPIIMPVTPERRPPSQTGETCPSISKAADDVFLRRVYLDLFGIPPGEDDVRLFLADKAAEKRTSLVNRLLRGSTATTRSCVQCHSGPLTDNDVYSHFVQALTAHQPFHGLLNASKSVRTGDRLFLAHPGVVFAGEGILGIDTKVALPDDVSITITHTAQQPAKVTIRTGARSYEVTEADYREKLPDDLAASVDAALHGAWLRDASMLNISLGRNPGAALIEKTLTAPAQPVPTPGAAPPKTDEALDRLLKQFEAMNGQMAELRQAIRALEEARRAPK